MSDLVRGRFPVSNPVLALLGQTTNVVNSNVPARTNLEFLGIGNPTDGALASTGVCCSVPIPVEPGTVISKVSLFIGATAEATGTHAFAAIYSGIASPALIAQSADVTGAAALAASARYDFSLSSPTQITTTHAPNGFIYATVAVTAGTIPTALVVATPTAIGYQWYTTGPKFLSATHDSSVGGTAPATMGSQTAKAVAPIMVLT